MGSFITSYVKTLRRKKLLHARREILVFTLPNFGKQGILLIFGLTILFLPHETSKTESGSSERKTLHSFSSLKSDFPWLQ